PLASVNSAGTRSGGGTAPVISADGRFVAFLSDASNLVANDINGATDVFVRDLQTGTTTLASVNSAGTRSGAAGCYAAAMSADGRFVTFVSDASDLVTIDTGRVQDVFVRDLKTRTTTLVSVNSAGTGSGDSVSFGPAISPAGPFVASLRPASDLVPNDTNGATDVFVRRIGKQRGKKGWF